MLYEYDSLFEPRNHWPEERALSSFRHQAVRKNDNCGFKLPIATPTPTSESTRDYHDMPEVPASNSQTEPEGSISSKQRT